MTWPALLSCFIGGACSANAVPHLAAGTMGRPFPSPFAKPPGQGFSSPTVNVLWAAANILIGYVLVCRIGDFDPQNTASAAAFGLGALVLSLVSARHFGRLNGGNGPERR